MNRSDLDVFPHFLDLPRDPGRRVRDRSFRGPPHARLKVPKSIHAGATCGLSSCIRHLTAGREEFQSVKSGVERV